MCQVCELLGFKNPNHVRKLKLRNMLNAILLGKANLCPSKQSLPLQQNIQDGWCNVQSLQDSAVPGSSEGASCIIIICAANIHIIVSDKSVT